LIDALSFVVSFIAIFRLAGAVTAPGKSELHPILREFLGGIRLFTGNTALTTLFLAAVLVMLGAEVIQAPDIFFVTQNLHTSLVFYGLLNTVLGGGACSS
jgi:hypothetical protein